MERVVSAERHDVDIQPKASVTFLLLKLHRLGGLGTYNISWGGSFLGLLLHHILPFQSSCHCCLRSLVPFLRAQFYWLWAVSFIPAGFPQAWSLGTWARRGARLLGEG